jgi:hypothetical protein
MDGVDGFFAALRQSRLVRPPDEYIDLIVIPAVLHIDPLRLLDYPPVLRETLRAWVMTWLAGGQGLNLDVVQRDG